MSETTQNRAGGAPKGNKNSRTHGLHSMRSALKELGSRAVDKRTATGKALAAWQGEIIQDLGGPDALSTQQLAILDLAVKTKLLLDSVDCWLLSQRSIVNARKRCLIPAVGQRVHLADSLTRYLTTLGLERKQAPAPSLQDYMRQKALEKSENEQTTENPSNGAAASPAQRDALEPASEPQPRDGGNGRFVEKADDSETTEAES